MKSMRKLNVVVLMMVVALLVAACGGGGNGSNSNNDNNASSGGNDTAAIEAAAREFIRVSTTADFVSLRELTCEAQRSGIDSLIEQMGGEDALTALAEMQGEVETDLSGITVNVTNQTADSADVALTGQVSVTVAGQTVSEDIGTSSQTARFVREGGQWRFCESIDG